MLSGIGPEKHLHEQKIDFILNLEGVGRNLQDHVAAGGMNFLFDSPVWTRPIGAGIVPSRMLTLQTFYSFLFERKGPKYALPFCEVTGFINTR